MQRSLQEGNVIGETLVNLGNIQADTGQPEKGRAFYLEAIDYLTPLDNDRALGVLYSNLALQDLHLHRPESAIEAFHTALDYHRKVGNEDGLATTYGQLGKAFLQLGNLQKAEACLNNATEHFTKLGHGAGEAGALRLLADVYTKREDHISALRCMERVVQIDQTYRLPQYEEDRQRLARLRGT
jgi:tetratricopeptide (TPR) repeat protein